MRVVRRVDRGGFGFVDELETDSGDRVARKCFDPQSQDAADLPNLRRRFEREVRIQSALKHPNIMPIYDKHLADDPPWFTMPLATMSLDEKLAEDHQTNGFDTTPWPDILAAVEELHRLGYVHRDLKPANILLVQGSWVLSDFGLILPTMRDTTILTGIGSAYGSLNYAAPEQAADFRNTPNQTDIYALGCILHDATTPAASRIPYTQIRGSGIYGPLLEKCTEPEPSRRFPTIAALRAALFDLWRTSSFAPPPATDEAVLQQVLDEPGNSDVWRHFLRYVEGPLVRGPMLKAITSQLLLQLAAIDEVLYSRLMNLICNWAAGTHFDFAYCDVIGDRLLDAYRVAPVRVRCDIVLAALELGVSHHRWHVMRQAGGMLGRAADTGLVDRILIEISLDPLIENKLRTIEVAIGWLRRDWHESIADFLNKDRKDDPEPGT